jgi:hypothetical protein
MVEGKKYADNHHGKDEVAGEKLTKRFIPVQFNSLIISLIKALSFPAVHVGGLCTIIFLNREMNYLRHILL